MTCRTITPRLAALLLSASALASGCTTEGVCQTNPEDPVCCSDCQRDRSRPWCDANEWNAGSCAEPTCDCNAPPDAGPDAGPFPDGGDAGPPDAGPDAGPCGMACPSGMPVCDEASGTCVQCNDADSSACTGDTAFCDTTMNLCVACLGDADCTEAGAARCEAGSCVPCDDSGQCSSVPGDLGVCAAGTCVQCSVMDETPCSGTSCDPATNTCTLTPLGMTPTCGACVADSECMTDHRCVPVEFDGSAHGNYCLRTLASGCVRPLGSVLMDRMSLSGAAEADYCGPDEATVSCDAVRALIDGLTCSGGTDAECAADGALCRTVGGFANQCTYACSGANECLESGPGSTCGAGHCGS